MAGVLCSAERRLTEHLPPSVVGSQYDIKEVIHMQVKTQLTAGFDLEDYAGSGGN